MEQAQAFLDESDCLADLLSRHQQVDWDTPTQFKGWTINDVVVHLHFWNKAADLSLTDEPAFERLLSELMGKLQDGGLRHFENSNIQERGPALFDNWQTFYRDMAARWSEVDPTDEFH